MAAAELKKVGDENIKVNIPSASRRRSCQRTDIFNLSLLHTVGGHKLDHMAINSTTERRLG